MDLVSLYALWKGESIFLPLIWIILGKAKLSPKICIDSPELNSIEITIELSTNLFFPKGFSSVNEMEL